MKWINTNGLSLLGPGSEWFWTALSTIAVVVSLLAIYRQIRLQTDVKETQQLNELAKDWESERVQRLRLAVFLGVKEGRPVREIAAAWRIAGFWDLVGGLARGRTRQLRHDLRDPGRRRRVLVGEPLPVHP